VWNASVLTQITPFSGTMAGRIWQGGTVYPQYRPLSWGVPGTPLAQVRICGARNGVFTGQVGVSSDEPIRGLSATMSDLVQSGGAGKIPAAAAQVCYQGYPEAYPRSLGGDPNTSLLDVLYEKPPAEVPVRKELRGGEAAGAQFEAACTWTDGGALVPVWIKVRVPADAPAGSTRAF